MLEDETPLDNIENDFGQEMLSKRHLVIVCFWASWSGPCSIMDLILKALSVEFKGKIKVKKISFDDNKLIGDKYNVNKEDLPVFLFFHKGKLLDRLAGLVSKNEFSFKIMALLQTIK